MSVQIKLRVNVEKSIWVAIKKLLTMKRFSEAKRVNKSLSDIYMLINVNYLCYFNNSLNKQWR